MKTKYIFRIIVLIILMSSVKSQAWDTTAAKYYPLKVGNVYIFNKSDLWFSCNPHNILARYSVRIENTVLKTNGKTYYRFSGWWNLIGFGSPNWNYQRIDSASMNVYAYDSTNNGEFLLDSLMGSVNTHFDCERLNFIHPMGWYERIDQLAIFNAVRSRKQFQCSGPILAGTYYYLVDGIGFTGYSICELGTGEEYSLKGCVINGVVYGDTIVTGVQNNNDIIPEIFSLSQNYPNPFNPTTIINYSIPTIQYTILKVYNALGKLVATIVNESQNAGSYNYQFSTVNYQLPSGIYYYVLKTDNFTDTKKMLLLK